jgi:D-alanyl-D-alanine carboxypeptidase
LRIEDLETRMAGNYAPYGASTAYVFKGRREENGKSWSDYLIAFGPGSTLKFSIALDGEGKVVSLGFDGF